VKLALSRIIYKRISCRLCTSNPHHLFQRIDSLLSDFLVDRQSHFHQFLSRVNARDPNPSDLIHRPSSSPATIMNQPVNGSSDSSDPSLPSFSAIDTTHTSDILIEDEADIGEETTEETLPSQEFFVNLIIGILDEYEFSSLVCRKLSVFLGPLVS